MLKQNKVMKKSILILIGAVLMIGSNAIVFAASEGDIPQKEEILIYTSSEFLTLVEDWTDLYSVENNKAVIKVSSLDNLKANKQKLLPNNWILASDAQNKDLCDKAEWKMLIGRDPVIAVTGSKNPLLKKINEEGLSKEEIKILLAANTSPDWGNFLDTNSSGKIDVYLEDNISVLSATANYTGLNQDIITNKRVRTGNKLISLLEKNPKAIGFIRLSEVISQDQINYLDGVAPLPIDVNANGKIDSFEDIYSSSESFLRGSWIGKYPREMISQLYMVSDSEPVADEEISFLTFLMINGDDILQGSNFISLVDEEAFSSMNRLEKAELPIAIGGSRRSGSTLILILCAVILLFAIPGIIARTRRGKTQNSDQLFLKGKALSPAVLKNPHGISFDKSHTWAFMEKDGNVRIGIDDFLQHVIGPISRVKLLNIGDKVTKGEKIIVLSNKGKQVSIKSPVSGVIVDHNQSLTSNPSLLNESPQADGWIYMIEPVNWQTENRIMMMGSQYLDWVKDEISRLKDFLLWALKENMGHTGQLVLTDGGDVPDNILDTMEADVWEEFQEKFIDKTRKL